VAYHDPHVPWFLLDGQRFESRPLDAETLSQQDCGDHYRPFEPDTASSSNAPLRRDTRNAMKDANGYGHKVTKL
jgi:hypothetical protein